MERVEHLKIPLERILVATNNFDEANNYIAKGGFGSVYKGELSFPDGPPITVAVKRLDRRYGQGDNQFRMEIAMLSECKHPNIVSLVGFSDDGDERILVYVHASKGSLDQYICKPDLTWVQRLHISIGVARGLHYLHHELGSTHRVLHRDIKSANILLDEGWEAKVSDLGLARIAPANMAISFVPTSPCGTPGYADPAYIESSVVTKESDIYSFGVVLFEILCGLFLVPQAKNHYEKNTLDTIIIPGLRKQMKQNSLDTFSEIAYQCLKHNRSERPRMGKILEELEKALQHQVAEIIKKPLEHQASLKTAKIARVGVWGTKSCGGPQNRWAFLLKKDHKLKIITIDHGDLIYSLMFTTESEGVLYPFKAGGWNGGDTVSKVMLEDDEEIIGIDGTVGVTAGGYTIISSLSFITNKMIHGPFGRATETPFSVPMERGYFGGFYGLAGYYIDAIGVYMKASSKKPEIARTGIWGTKSLGGPQNQWYLQLDRNQHLKKITIDHGDLIYSLTFTTEYRGVEHTYERSGGWNGGDKVSEVTFAWDEEINAISGTVGVSGEYTIISSLSFITNKKTHGPYGRATGTPFTVPWDKGTFVGFYGLAGNYLDGIGVYLKATI